jgi:ribulose-5-phosphate 4-epimerase/fuculose-1-phosphate aldolase
MATQIRPNSERPSIDCSDSEWQARQELAAAYRIFDMLGWSESVYNHISLRVPEEEGAFLINPYGLQYSEICASNLVKIDIDGNKLAESPYGVNLAGFTQHAYFHRHLPRAHAICHVHTTATMAVCSLEEGLLPINFYACNLIGKLAYHDFEGVTVRAEEGVHLMPGRGASGQACAFVHVSEKVAADVVEAMNAKVVVGGCVINVRLANSQERKKSRHEFQQNAQYSVFGGYGEFESWGKYQSMFFHPQYVGGSSYGRPPPQTVNGGYHIISN